ncbi:MAG: peptidylprolyl isomerase [Actinomycetota bacterium]|nr:peptidylprolyl isomerase [Actinomycetota bacterium]
MTNEYDAAPDLTIDLAKSHKAVLHTSEGDITIDFYAVDAPQTVNNFLFLANDGFYDGVIFHRVIPGFMVQGGDPTGTGSGGPGYKFRDETHSKTSYKRGTLAMANSGPNTNGSQFFIMHADYGLPNQYTIFGEVSDGIEVVDAIAGKPTGAQDKPHDPVTINSVTVTEA